MAVQLPDNVDRHLYSNGVGFSTNSSPYSITVWIKADWAAGVRKSFVGIYNGTPSTGTPTMGLQIGTASGAGEISCWTYGGSILIDSPAGTMTTLNSKWAFVVYTWTGTTHMIYVNGIQVSTSTTVLPVLGTFTQVYINGYPPSGSTSETASFQVDSYAYYGRSLSKDEIITLYSAAGIRSGIVNGLIARYEFDEQSEGVAVTGCKDLTGKEQTLLPNGASATNITYTYVNTVSNQSSRYVHC